ncbi:MAG: hypothetical protein ACTH7H_01830, partial [Cobetia crustatorum]
GDYGGHFLELGELVLSHARFSCAEREPPDGGPHEEARREGQGSRTAACQQMSKMDNVMIDVKFITLM